MGVDLSTPGDLVFDLGFEGEVSDLSQAIIEGQRVNESVTPIQFGRAVAQGTVAGSSPSCKPVSSSGDKIIGLSVKNPTMPAAYGTNIASFAQYDNVPLLVEGPMTVKPVENWADGDAVYAIVSQGGKLGSASGGGASSDRLLVPNTRYKGAGTANTMGKVHAMGTQQITLGT